MGESKRPSREEAYALLTKYNQSESLIKHALTVEGVMKHFAGLYPGEDEEVWGIVGLVHDLDYEQFPEQHCYKTREILEGEGWPEEYIRAIESHGWELVNEVKPTSAMEKVLYTIDELSGLITATVLLRPSKSILDTEVKSVKKKWKQKGFAAGVNRDVIEKGVALLETDLDRVIEESILGMRAVAGEIGLQGEEADQDI